MYTKLDKVSILTEEENTIMQHLVSAFNQFERLMVTDQQNQSDLFDFGHYLEAAQKTLLVRAVRRMEPNLISQREGSK